MNKFLKTATALGAGVFSLAFAVTVASADTTSLTNTGDNVDVSAGSSSLTSVEVTNSNTAVITQSSTTTANTGHNDADRNIGDVSIDTGSAAVSNTFDAQANQNQTSIAGVGAGSSGDEVEIVNTGDDLDVYGMGGDSLFVDVDNSNFAVVTQASDSRVNTGHNDADRNIGDVSIETGNAGVLNDFEVDVNANATAISGLGGGNDGDTLSLVNTGDDVTIGDNCGMGEVSLLLQQRLCGDMTRISVENDNEAIITQVSEARVNTGHNDADRNIALDGDVSIDTGSASIGNVFSATANANATGINLAGLLNDDEDLLEIVNTGDDLDVENGTSVVTSVTVHSSNGAMVAQATSTHANTGHNDADRNIALDGDTSIFSGNAALAAAFMAQANWNWTMVGGSAFSMPSWWN